MKKFILLTVLILSVSHIGFCQQRTVKRNFKVTPDGKVKLNLKFGKTINVTSWNKDEVSFRASIEINRGKLNDALALTFSNKNGRLQITADYDKQKIKDSSATDCPQGNRYSKYSVSGDSGHYSVCARISYQVFVPRNASLTVKTINGDIQLVNLAGPVDAKSISGFVDLSWPSGRAARFALKTTSGETYTNLSHLKFGSKKKHPPIVGRDIKASLGTGGPSVFLKSISGNIYLRRAGS